MHSILIADDHAVVRAGYVSFIAADGGNMDIGQVANGAELLRTLRDKAWNLVLLDICLPDRTGISLLHELRRDFPKTRVLVISGLPEEQYAIEALRAGAAGYLSKDCAPSDLVSAVRRVLGGQRYVSAKIAEKMASEVGRAMTPRHEQLSERERQVFDRLAAGTTITHIARELELSIKTVSTYRSRVLEKMSFTSNADVTSYAIRQGLTTLSGGSEITAQSLSPSIPRRGRIRRKSTTDAASGPATST